MSVVIDFVIELKELGFLSIHLKSPFTICESVWHKMK